MTARPIWPNELLRLAGRLAGENAGRGKPRTVNLRRSISTAYYALFHELTIQATRVLVGNDGVGKAGTSPATRWFDHGQIKDLAEAATGVGRKARAIAPVLGQPHPDLERVADAFVTLQSARHLADYDHNYNVTRREARYYVEQAREAIRMARRLRDTEEGSYQRFLKLMVGAVGIAKNR